MAGTTADKLQGIIDAKADIASAITSKGGTVPSLFEDYGDAIRSLPSAVNKVPLLVGLQSGSGAYVVTAEDLQGVTYIKRYAFYDCIDLTSIEFPATIAGFDGGYTFRGCSNCLLFDFRRATSVPSLGATTAFQNTNADKKIVVPDALYSSWITATNWSSTTNGIVTAIVKASDYQGA